VQIICLLQYYCKALDAFDDAKRSSFGDDQMQELLKWLALNNLHPKKIFSVYAIFHLH